MIKEVVTSWYVSEGALDHLLSKENGMYLSFLFSFERSCGALAQLGERLLCGQRFDPLGSIESKDSEVLSIEN